MTGMTKLKESGEKERKNTGELNSIRWETGTLYSKMRKKEER